MMHMTSFSASPTEGFYFAIASEDLRDIVRQQIDLMSADGFTDFDIRWNYIALCIEASDGEICIRRQFGPSGVLEMERFANGGVGVKRFFDSEGDSVISEEVFEICDDR